MQHDDTEDIELERRGGGVYDGISVRTSSALVTIGQTSRRYFSRYFGNSVAKLLSSSRPDCLRHGMRTGRGEREGSVGVTTIFEKKTLCTNGCTVVNFFFFSR